MKFLLVETSAFLVLAYACANPGKSDSTNSNAQAPSADAAPSVENQGVGNIAFEAPAGLIDLQGYIVGSSDQVALRVVPDVSGSLGFVAVAPGTYDIILTARKVQSNGTVAPVGIRLSGIVVSGGKNSLLPTPDLQPTLDVRGKVHLQGDVSPAAVTVQVPGTHYRVPADANGDYVLASLPIGHHQIEISQPGFVNGGIGEQDFRDDIDLPTISLRREGDVLNSGVYYFGPAMTEGLAAKIILYFQTPKGMNQFRVGSVENLSKEDWSNLQSSVEIDMPAGKDPVLAVQYSKDGQQLSPIYNVTIPTE